MQRCPNQNSRFWVGKAGAEGQRGRSRFRRRHDDQVAYRRRRGPEQRFQSAKDLSFALSTLSGTDSSGVARITAERRSVSPWVLAASLLAAVIAAATTWSVLRHPVSAERMQFAIPVSGEVSHMT